MQITFLIFFLIFPFSSHAISVEFIGPCDKNPFYVKKIQKTQAQNVGELSLAILREAQIPHVGTENGINQIFNSPIGLDAYEVVADNEMMAYGWCYKVDDVIPEAYPNEVSLAGIKHITWFYGYAHFLNGNWIAQCLESHRRKSPFICKSSP
jgi:hypothetical protein